ncbi:hypothetical protein ACF09J_35100 [Streptomyces sp. NPDC014889]|uniref:hypothetical protein n=1 Tax=Streptomyces sp. NPDC014889 TaxID=3364928 RepID=UPI0036FD37CD
MRVTITTSGGVWMATSGQQPVIWTTVKKERRGRRRLIAAVGGVVLAVVVLALATRGGTSSKPPAADLPAPTPHSRDGAQSAAAKMAAVFGSERMFDAEARHRFLQSTYEPDQWSKEIQEHDDQYGPFTRQLGLDDQGRPPAGGRFISRAMPAGTILRAYTGSTAEIDVWCSTLFGLTGKSVSTEIPVESGWLTMSMSLHWTPEGWKLTKFEQTDGPEPTDKAAEFGTAPQL